MNAWHTFGALVARNCKLFFKDKGVFWVSLMAPLILLFLFVAFLGNVYRDSIRSVAAGFVLTDAMVESIASGWLISSLIAVCAVTIAFTANTIMVQDRVTGQRNDILVTPVARPLVALGYFAATFSVTAVICLVALSAGFIYMAVAGWHLTVGDVLLTLCDTLLLVLFGTALSSVVCHFLHSQGGVTGIQATVSAAYGFLCGAYMPISNLTEWLKNVIMFFPGTYGTGLLHSHLMRGAIEALKDEGLPEALVLGMKDGFDCNLYFFGTSVPQWVCFLVLAAVTLALIGLYILLLTLRRKRSACDR